MSSLPVYKYCYLSISLLLLIISIVNADIISSYNTIYNESMQMITVKVTLEGGSEMAYASEYPRDFVIVVDNSLSMREIHIDKSRMEWVKDAIIQFLNSLSPYKCRVSIVTFSDDVKTIVPLTYDFEKVRKGIENVQCQGFTSNLADAVVVAIKVLKQSKINAIPIIVVLTDGGDDKSASPIEESINFARKEGIIIYVFGFGERKDINEILLKKYVKETGGYYKFSHINTLGDDLSKLAITSELLSAIGIQIMVQQSDDSIIDYNSIETMISPGVILTQKDRLEFVCPKISKKEKIEISFRSFTPKKGDVNAGNIIIKYIDKNGEMRTVKLETIAKIPGEIPLIMFYIIIGILALLSIVLLYLYLSVKGKINIIRRRVISYLEGNKNLTVTDTLIDDINSIFRR